VFEATLLLLEQRPLLARFVRSRKMHLIPHGLE